MVCLISSMWTLSGACIIGRGLMLAKRWCNAAHPWRRRMSLRSPSMVKVAMRRCRTLRLIRLPLAPPWCSLCRPLSHAALTRLTLRLFQSRNSKQVQPITSLQVRPKLSVPPAMLAMKQGRLFKRNCGNLLKPSRRLMTVTLILNGSQATPPPSTILMRPTARLLWWKKSWATMR